MSERIKVEPTDDQYRLAIVEIGDLVGSIDSLTINVRKEQLAVLLQGLAFYVHDTARAALILLDRDTRASAAALTRIAIEHATMAQWIAIQPDGASKYLDELAAQAKTFGAKAEGIGISIPDDIREEYRRYDAARPVQEIRQAEQMFGALDPSGWMYMQWKLLCGYVHPSSTTTTMYVREQPNGTVLWTRNADALPARALLFSLAMSSALATAPLLDLVKSKPYKSRLQKISERARIPLWLTDDGKPPKHKAKPRSPGD